MPRKLVFALLLGMTLLAASYATAQRADVKAADSRPANANMDARPLYYTRAITDDDLIGRSLRELNLMRNTIYARAGNKFRKKWLNDYFSAQPWYHALDKMDESKITPLDRKNAEI